MDTILDAGEDGGERRRRLSGRLRDEWRSGTGADFAKFFSRITQSRGDPVASAADGADGRSLDRETLIELIRVDVDERAKRGMVVALAQYRDVLPDHPDVVDAAFATIKGGVQDETLGLADRHVPAPPPQKTIAEPRRSEAAPPPANQPPAVADPARTVVERAAVAASSTPAAADKGATIVDPRRAVGPGDGPARAPARGGAGGAPQVDRQRKTVGAGDDPDATTPMPAAGGKAPAATRAEVAESVAGYDIIAPIAKGGMGIVYRARQRRLDRVVALKMILRAEAASDDEIRRFHAEAEAAAHLDHPGIVPIFEVGEDRGRHFFSMAYVDGGSLSGKLAAGPMDPASAAKLVRTVAEAVDYAHGRGIVHRDLKPANILLGADGSPKVTDFGIAKRVETQDGLTMTGQVIGTPAYMPPEQARGDSDAIGPRSDVYAIGAILYHALTGKPPFSAATVIATLKQVIDAEPVPPRRLNPQLDRDLDTVVLKCLEKDPARRYASAADCAADLGRYLDGIPILARRTSIAERAWKWSRRRPAVAMLVAMSILALVSMGVGGVFYADAANKRAELATRQLREQLLLDATRRDLQAAILRAGELLAAANLAEADDVIREALAKAGTSAELEQERSRLEKQREELGTLVAAERERAAARTSLQTFAGHHETASFYGSQSFGLDPQRNARLAAGAAREALAIWRLDRDGTDGPVVPEAFFSAAERRQIGDQCEEMLLILADAVMRGAENDDGRRDALAESTAAIDRCVRLKGGETRATRLQRAESLRLVGDEAGAARERAAAATEGGAETAAEHFLVGRLLLRQEAVGTEAFARAKDEFEKALLVDPDHFWAQYCLGMHALRDGRPEIADVHLTSCIARRPEFAWSWILRGAARTATDARALAAADFTRALELTDDPEARHITLTNWAVLDVASGRLADARARIGEALGGDVVGYQALLTLASIERDAGDDTASLEALSRAVTMAPGEARIRRERARLHLLAGRFAAAEEDYREALGLDAAALPEARADDLTQLGEAILRQGRVGDALDTFDQAVAHAPGHPRAQLFRGSILVDQGRFREAIVAFDAGLQHGAPTVELHLTRALCRANLGDYAGAIDDYTRALELKPSAEVYCRRGWLYTLRGNPLFGLKDFEKALAIDGRHADAHAGRGLSLSYLGRHADAVAAAERALAGLSGDERSFRDLFKVATIFAAASPRVVLTEEDRRIPGPSARQLSIRYLQRAAELLQQALEREHPDRHDDLWAAHVADDAHFKPLLDEPEFRRIWREIADRAAGDDGATAGAATVGPLGDAGGDVR